MLRFVQQNQYNVQGWRAEKTGASQAPQGVRQIIKQFRKTQTSNLRGCVILLTLLESRRLGRWHV